MLLGVNIDHVATLRNARGGLKPSVLDAAKICEKLEVSGITTHLREDRRHIKDEDVFAIKENISTRLNLEMAMTEEMKRIALDLKPDACCIVPEKREEVTTEGGLDVAGQIKKAIEFVKPLNDAGIVVSMFIDPDKNQIDATLEANAPFIELHTGAYSNEFGTDLEEDEFQKLKIAALYAQKHGLKVNAGHGLDYENVKRMHEIPDLIELNIGHSIISRAIFVGLERAIIEMRDLIK